MATDFDKWRQNQKNNQGVPDNIPSLVPFTLWLFGPDPFSLTGSINIVRAIPKILVISFFHFFYLHSTP
jgi:hypothetical protein